MSKSQLKRRRLPVLHMITANEGGVPLREALAAFFFYMLHDKIKHDCLIEAHPDTIDSPNEEWAYLPDETAAIFFILADGAVEQTQRWINSGQEDPYTIPLGPLVERPQWAVIREEKDGLLDHVKEARDLVTGLLKEVQN